MFEAIVAFFMAWPVIVMFCLMLSIFYIITAEDNSYWALSILGTILASIIYCKPILAFVTSSWYIALATIAVYGIVGAAWSVFRWFKFCKYTVKEYPYRGTDTFYKTADEYYTSILNISTHKSRLIGWIIYWPWSMLWNIVGDFFTGIYDTLDGVYRRVANYVVKNATRGLPK